MKKTTLFIIPGACSFGSMVALEWLGKPYQIGITTPEIRKSPEFLKINPLGKVGTLIDNNNVIYENLAIILYMIDQNPSSKIAIPVNSKERIEAYKWLSYLSSTLHVAFGPLFSPNSFVDESAIDMFKTNSIKKLKGILSYVDTYLQNNSYLITKTPTVIDAQAYGLLRWSVKFGVLDDFKHIQSFISRMNKEVAVKNALNIEQNKTDELINSSFTGYYNFN